MSDLKIPIQEIIEEIDEYCDGNEDLYNGAIHQLTDEESEQLTVREFLVRILLRCKEDES